MREIWSGRFAVSQTCLHVDIALEAMSFHKLAWTGSVATTVFSLENAYQRHCISTLHRSPYIGQNTWRIGERRAGERAGQEASNQQSTKIRRERAEEVEGQIENERAIEHPSSPKELGQRRPQQRSKYIAQQEERDNQTRSFCRDMQISRYALRRP